MSAVVALVGLGILTLWSSTHQYSKIIYESAETNNKVNITAKYRPEEAFNTICRQIVWARLFSASGNMHGC